MKKILLSALLLISSIAVGSALLGIIGGAEATALLNS